MTSPRVLKMTDLPHSLVPSGMEAWLTNSERWISDKCSNGKEDVDVSKNRGTTPKMDGLFHGKPYLNGWFGDTIIFGNTHVYIGTTTPHPGCNRHREDDIPCSVGNPNLNLHLWLASWVRGRTNVYTEPAVCGNLYKYKWYPTDQTAKS